MDRVYVNYQNFKKNHKDTAEGNSELFLKLKEIFTQKYGNALNEELLYVETNDAILTTSQMSKLYQLMDDAPFSIIMDSRIREVLFPSENLGVGDNIKDFALKDLNGELISTTQFRGSIFLIDFWASWCKPCREEFPELIKVYKKNHENGFDILGVSIDNSKDKWVRAIKKDGLPWSNVLTEGGQKSKVPIDYRIFGVPRNYLVDEEGKIIAKDVSIKQLQILLTDN